MQGTSLSSFSKVNLSVKEKMSLKKIPTTNAKLRAPRVAFFEPTDKICT